MLDLDTVRTAGTGTGVYAVTSLGILPEIVSLGIGIATLVYLVIKIKKELKG